MNKYYIPIIYPSAGEFWIYNDFSGSGNKLSFSARQLINLPDHYELHPNKNIIKMVADEYKLSLPLKLMVTKDIYRRENQLISCAVRPAVFPSQSFVELSPLTNDIISAGNCMVLMSSPELCFLQAAVKLSFFELIKFGYDLCSIYMPDATALYRQTSRTPATSALVLKEFLQHLSVVYGLSNARKAVKYIKDSSNSPMETRNSILMILPYSYGGFSIDGYELNADIYLSREASAVLKRKKCRVDNLWRKEKVILEYDSNETHLSAEQHDLDKRRTLALEIDGFKVFPVTAKMLSTNKNVEDTFIALRKMLGRRVDLKQIENTRNKRIELLRYLRTI